MNKLFVCFIIFLGVKFWFFAKKYDYKITIFAGKTGSGKTMLATSYALDRIKKGGLVFSTYYIEGAYKLPFDFYNYNFPADSLLVIDEAQIGLDSRDYKNLTQKGISGKLKNKLSMHRHQKLDIFFITQNPEEIDAQVRRYATQMFYCNRTFLKRHVNFKDKKIEILPYFQHFEIWPDISTYELYKKRSNPLLKVRDYGVRKGFKFISKRTFSKYNTNQQDKASSMLPYINLEIHSDINGLIDTST